MVSNTENGQKAGAAALLADFLTSLSVDSVATSCLVHHEALPSRSAVYGGLEHPLSETVRGVLGKRGIQDLYIHQTQAINALRRRKHVIVSTSTASGKSMCYNLPVMSVIEANPKATALYMFPTKALSHDQIDSLRDMAPDSLGLAVNDYDGDTPKHRRQAVKKESNIVVTNPDMLNVGMLPYHRGWSAFLGNLRFIVIDEAHVYRGIFGAHVALIIRRLRRICREYGSDPQFVLCSATLSNAGEHANALTGLEFEVIDQDGSPSGGRDFVFFNPAYSSTGETVNAVSANLTADLVARGVKTMTFARSIPAVERISDMAQDQIGGGKAGLLQPYRAGYLPDYRRETERKLADGRLLALISTNAMELGVDVGGLDATIISGYPGSISSVWQQAGRSGRSSERALSILIMRTHPVDQFFAANPSDFFSRPFESARLSASNRVLLEQHLQCAAAEIPLSRRDFDMFDPNALQEVAARMVKEGKLAANSDLTRTPSVNAPSSPAFQINIRSADPERWKVADELSGEYMENADSEQVFNRMYPGAVHLHRGNNYLVRAVDRENLRVTMAPTGDLRYFTMLDINSDVEVEDVLHRKSVGATEVGLARVTVTKTADQYMRKDKFSDEVIDVVEINWPERTFETVGLWFSFPHIRKNELLPPNAFSALAALVYPAVSAVSMFTMSDERDVGSMVFKHKQQAGQAGLFVWDNHPGGVGISELSYGMIGRIWDRMLAILRACPCREGCPMCIESSFVDTDDGMDKQGAIRLMRIITSRPTSSRTAA